MGVPSPQNRAAEFRGNLEKRVLAADGAMATMLFEKGGFIHRSIDELNLSLPALVRDVHREYVQAGAEILETNTFGANRIRLGAFGFAQKARQINLSGVRIAREAAREQAFVAGAIGPLGVYLEPLGPLSAAEARAIFREQAEALVEAGVDLLMLETFRDLNELREAVFAAREAAGEEIAIAAHVSIEEDGTLVDGTSTEEFTRRMEEWPVDIAGLNCSFGPKTMLDAIEKMAGHTRKPLSAFPNAGLPDLREGRYVYSCSPEYMAQYARRFLRAGARIIGGCCGTTPEHIREMSVEVRHFESSERTPAIAVPEAPAGEPRQFDEIAAAEKSELGAKLSRRRFVAMVEILPPKGVDVSKEIEGAKLCKKAGIDCINVPDGPRASARLSALATCQLIQQQAGIETVLHFSCRDRNLLSIQSDLLAAHAMGVRNLLCITGDPPRAGAYPAATAVFDVDAAGLVNIASNLNRGLDLGGNPVGSQTALLLGVGANPSASNLDDEMRRLERKIKAGAEFIMTQPVFDLDLLEAFVKRAEEFRIPVIAGIWPLASFRNGEFMIHELRVPVPPAYMARMSTAQSGNAARAEGIAIARDLVQRARPMVAGAQISAPSGRYDIAIEVAEAIGGRDFDGDRPD